MDGLTAKREWLVGTTASGLKTNSLGSITASGAALRGLATTSVAGVVHRPRPLKTVLAGGANC